MHSLVGWAKARALALDTVQSLVRRAHASSVGANRAKKAWARRTRGVATWKGRAIALAHPTKLPLNCGGQTRAHRALAKRTHRAEKAQYLKNIVPEITPKLAGARRSSHRAPSHISRPVSRVL